MAWGCVGWGCVGWGCVGGGGTESAARAATEGGMSDETEGFLEETTSSNIWVSTWLRLG